ncbi:cellulase family glycosylhydrolase [Saccharibacillus alkalitolerans]|uniref:Endoglucanase n=1 Tax=Saccharibacillus alkalitolerans TaxID=2705290 RepID=A0ABX0FB92_9BACL|nr:cellulase family glycosylhydrolase [Saccharibacillus alkalitolerans]NGZ78233.1 cellulase family glycosylhydrolase [Saccharibacillus alkalitolerans]
MYNRSFRKGLCLMLACLLVAALASWAGAGNRASAKEASKQAAQKTTKQKTAQSAAAVRTAQSASASTFVGKHGQLAVKNGKLIDASGNPVQLKGMSSHGIQWFGGYVNKESMKWLRDDWGLNVFRVAMYTEADGYISNPALKNKVKEAVDAAVELGIYVIVDWHILSDGDPNKYKTQSKAFFKEMAQTYGDTPNIIYEIANEPNGNVNWQNQIKPYAEEVIATIRAEDPDNPIIVGTGTWSQDIQDAAASPLKASNVLYAVHFYAGTHGAWLRDRIDAAMNKGLAVFVSEWGTSDASGNGGPFLAPSKEWTDFMADRGISWANWSLSDKQEASAALAPGASLTGGWTQSQLSESGRFVREQMRAGYSAPGGATPVQVPGQVQGLTAQAGSSKVTLKWNALSGADSYIVKRAAGGGTYSILQKGITQPSFTDSAAVNGTSYRYKVSAVNAKGAGADSAEVSAKPSASVTPPTTPPSTGGSGDLKLLYRTMDSNSADNALRPIFNIRNTGSSAVDLKNVKIRYYYTNEGGVGQNYFCDWAQVGSANVKGTFGRTSGSPAGATDYLELSFASGSVPAGGESGEIQSRVHKADWSNYDETDDYSYKAGQSEFAEWNRVALYVNGQLVYGIEP